MLMSLLSPIILFDFENLTTYLPFNYSQVNECNFIEVTNQLVGTSHTYGGGALTVNDNAISHHINDVVSTVIHPYQHHHTVTPCKRHFFYVILNGGTINLVDMIYKTIIFLPIAPFLFSLHYPSLISM